MLFSGVVLGQSQIHLILMQGAWDDSIKSLREDIQAGLTDASADSLEDHREYMQANRDSIQKHTALTSEYYGISYNYATDVFTRRGKTAYSPVGAKPAEDLLTVHRYIRRCVVNDDGTVNYYLKPSNSALKVNDSTAVLTGADGQVMVEYKKFYYQWTFDGDNYTLDISPEPLYGFSVYPAFLDADGNEVDYVYVGAYPATLFDATAGVIVGEDDNIYTAGDKLVSVSGLKPKTNETRPGFRDAATARGTGWHQLDFNLMTMLQMLFVVEYAGYDMQTMISAGNTKFTAWNYDTDISATGKSNSLGNYSGGQSTTSGNSGDFISYRGVEDICGNTWQFVDGVNINNDGTSSKLYTTNHYTYLADNTVTNYSYKGDLAVADGYIKRILANAGFMPSIVGGSSSTYLADYHYTEFDTAPAGGWRGLLLGGSAAYGVAAGVFDVGSDAGSSLAHSSIGGRLCRSGVN